MIIQLTGLSGAGKTTIAGLTAIELSKHGFPVEIIDGDRYRATICKDLGFSEDDRKENIRRLGAVANDFALSGHISIIAAINPFECIRKELAGKYNAKIVWVNCAIERLIERDTKGLYKRALLPDGHPEKVYHFTGISQAYESPENADLILNTDRETPVHSAQVLADFILKTQKPQESKIKQIISPNE
ncbi:adenylyl-sulfate kinase [Solitalea lacus]|uniref:adenylyl-sulfate kinase n=1 Tax=Solitalea lacus TaxID=2911172 RepID=UPI001EDB2B66|nr:adenylyl-sulfate kinase [Solitalea lacus]UKJ06773.1 adenylyl-sulfate kinase [Solitalea lacus]